MRGDLRPQLGGLLGHGPGDGAALGFALVVYDHACVVLAVDESAVRPPPGSSLSDDDGGMHLLSKLLHTLLDGAEDDVSDGARGEPVEGAPDTSGGDDVQVLGSGVVSAVEGGGDGEAASDSELDTDSTCL